MKDPGKPFGSQLPPSLMRDLRDLSTRLGVHQSDAVAKALKAWLKAPPPTIDQPFIPPPGHPERLHTRLPVALIARVKARAARRSIRVYDAVAEAVSAWVVEARKEVAK